MVEFRLLGPVEVWADGHRLPAGQPQQRAVLAALLVDAGQPVTPQTLVDRVWGETPPQGARPSLHAHIARIRRVLQLAGEGTAAPPRLLLRPGGYVLDVDVERVDMHRFRGLLRQSREPECPDAHRVQLLRGALALWRGEPLAGLPGSWATRTRESWWQQYPDAAVAWAYSELRVANPGPVISRLSELVGEYPLVESLAAVLMRALYAAGRGPDALGQYTRIRSRLADELGVDPGPELQAIHQAILRGDMEAPPGRDAPPVSVRQPVPAQLPADVSGFTGRAAHLAQLDALLPGRSGQASTAVRIAVVSGTAGVGKTALAVHWAHSAASQFPDGHLYVNLRGFDPADQVIGPTEAVHGFLGALGVAPERIPAQLDAQAALYRSLLVLQRHLACLRR